MEYQDISMGRMFVVYFDLFGRCESKYLKIESNGLWLIRSDGSRVLIKCGQEYYEVIQSMDNFEFQYI